MTICLLVSVGIMYFRAFAHLPFPHGWQILMCHFLIGWCMFVTGAVVTEIFQKTGDDIVCMMIMALVLTVIIDLLFAGRIPEDLRGHLRSFILLSSLCAQFAGYCVNIFFDVLEKAGIKLFPYKEKLQLNPN